MQRKLHIWHAFVAVLAVPVSIQARAQQSTVALQHKLAVADAAPHKKYARRLSRRSYKCCNAGAQF